MHLVPQHNLLTHLPPQLPRPRRIVPLVVSLDIVYILPALARVRGVAGLDDEARGDPVEGAAVVVAVETVLDEVAGGERGLLREEGDGEGAGSGVQDHGGGGGWFGYVLG